MVASVLEADVVMGKRGLGKRRRKGDRFIWRKEKRGLEKRGQIYLKRKRGQIYLMRCRSSFC
jgi:hypothetical protein